MTIYTLFIASLALNAIIAVCFFLAPPGEGKAILGITAFLGLPLWAVGLYTLHAIESFPTGFGL